MSEHTIIEFADPPVASSSPWKRAADTLRARPGEWANLGTINTSYANRISRGELKDFRPAGSFETVMRNVGAGKRHEGTIYVRYVGEKTAKHACSKTVSDLDWDALVAAMRCVQESATAAHEEHDPAISMGRCAKDLCADVVTLDTIVFGIDGAR